MLTSGRDHETGPFLVDLWCNSADDGKFSVFSEMTTGSLNLYKSAKLIFIQTSNLYRGLFDTGTEFG